MGKFWSNLKCRITKFVIQCAGVEESVVLNFYNDQEQNLLVTSVNILSVYRIREGSRLELTDEYELWGNVCSICRVRFNGATKAAGLR